jgi:aminomuconate-semialdehyde/2-hydroxymuconate-6-semialdehyde dehydrogenase
LDELAVLESRDTGKPISVARTVDIPRAVANFRFFAGAVRHDETGFHPMAGALNYTIRRPVGVAALITPWNLPLYLLTWKVAPALAMGNTVVAKPSELTPATACVLAEILTEVGVPPGVFNLVHGLGAEAGQALTSHPGVDLVSFTGGTVTGAAVAAAAAPSFKKLSLELGGKNPTLVFADADFENAVAGAARAGFLNQGQICLCGSRVLVEESIYERFRDAFVRRVSTMQVGDPTDESTEFGALISREHRRKVESYVALAREEGGSILCGGKRPDLPPPHDRGAFYEPTVVDGLSSTSRTATEEIFGPVVTLHPFRDEAHAVHMANEVRYGLAASVWTSNLGRAHRVSAAIETGMVWVNTWLMRDLRVPFGGVKDSGVGREGGRHSLDFFSEVRNVCVAF